MPSEITAERLNEMVSQWPVEARPKMLGFAKYPGAGRRPQWFDTNGNDTFVAHAIDLHVASGLRWMLTKGHVGIKDIGQVRVVVSFPAPRDPVIEYSKIGGTLIEALHAAIMATAKEGA